MRRLPHNNSIFFEAWSWKLNSWTSDSFAVCFIGQNWLRRCRNVSTILLLWLKKPSLITNPTEQAATLQFCMLQLASFTIPWYYGRKFFKSSHSIFITYSIRILLLIKQALVYNFSVWLNKHVSSLLHAYATKNRHLITQPLYTCHMLPHNPESLWVGHVPVSQYP